MLKRYQVLLSDWLAEYAQFISQEYDISFSEAIRIIMCLGAVEAVRELYPRHKSNLPLKHMVKNVKEMAIYKLKEEVIHQKISQGYFEARKAIEFRMSEAKKRK